MRDFNVGRWLAGGIVAGLVVWVLEGALATLYVEEMTARLTELGLLMDMSATHVVGSIAVTLLGGLAMVFFYAVACPALGEGMRTAMIVAFAVFCGGYLPSLIGYYMLGLFRAGLLMQWAVQGLLEMLVAGVVGAWLYKPEPGAA